LDLYVFVEVMFCLIIWESVVL